MSHATYVPGQKTFIVSGPLALLVDCVDRERVDALWGVISSGGSEIDVIEVLTADGIAVMPDFACMVTGGTSTRLLLRGAAVARVLQTSGSVAYDSGGVATWSERVIASPLRVELRLAAEEPAPVWLPLVSGVAQADCVSWGAPEPSAVRADGPEAAVPTEALAGQPEPDPMPEPAVESEPVANDAEPEPVVPEVEDSPALHAASRDPDETKVEIAAEGFEAWFGDTVARDPEDAAVREIEPAKDAPGLVPPWSPAPPPAGDHDGMTVAGKGCAGLLASRSTPVPSPKTSARLTLSDGQTVDVDGGVFVGRAPQARSASDGTLPRLVTVGGPQSDISRTHLEITAEGMDILAKDVSTNGTILTRPGEAPERLPSGRKTILRHGSVLDLGDGVSITVETERRA